MFITSVTPRTECNVFLSLNAGQYDDSTTTEARSARGVLTAMPTVAMAQAAQIFEGRELKIRDLKLILNWRFEIRPEAGRP